MGLSIKDLEKLQKLGKIRGFTVQELKPAKVNVGGRIVTRQWGKQSKEKDWLGSNLLCLCNELCLKLKEEYVFDTSRKWRADYCIEEYRILIEYEGVFSGKSRHTSVIGYSGDTEKYTEATKQGWMVLRYTALNYKNVIKDVKTIIDGK